VLICSQGLLARPRLRFANQMHCGMQSQVLDRIAVMLTRQSRQRRIVAGAIQAFRSRVVEVCTLRTAMAATRW